MRNRNFLLIFVGCMIIYFSCGTKPEKKGWFYKKNSIQILLLGNVEDKAVWEVKDMIATQFHPDTILLTHAPLPDSCITTIKTKRYRADKLLRYLTTRKDESATKLIALTEQDISVTKYGEKGKIKSPTYKYADWGIMGLAYRGGGVCIVSCFRLQSEDKKLFYQRLRKVSMHELGHNYGNPHCSDKTCVMTDAVERISTVDGAQEWFCEKCEKKI